MRAELSALTRSQVESLTPGEFSHLFARSAVKRAKLAGLLRNARRDHKD